MLHIFGSFKMRLTIIVFMLVFTFFVSGCFKISEPGFKPSDDPLINKIFEHKLKEVGIDFEVNNQGFYSFSNASVEKAQELSNLAHSDAGHTKSLVVDQGCALNTLRAELDSAGLVYVVFERQGKYLIKTTAHDAENFQVMQRYVSAENRCENGRQTVE